MHGLVIPHSWKYLLEFNFTVSVHHKNTQFNPTKHYK